MKQIYFTVLTIIFFLSQSLFAQDIESTIEDCKKEVHQINNLTLERAVLRYTKNFEGDYAKFPCFKNVDENISYIYKDNKGNIRKFLTMRNHPEWLGYDVHYFDTMGNVVYSYIYNLTSMSPQFYGYRYMSGGKQIFCDMDVYNEEQDVWERIMYNGGEQLYTYCNSFDNILHTDSIMFFCKLLYNVQDIFNTDIFTEKVCFVSPEKGAKTIINARGVNIREKSNTNSRSILVPLFGEIVEILEKVREENIEPFGKSNWFKVSINNKTGYIFGAFLEPIEKEVRK